MHSVTHSNDLEHSLQASKQQSLHFQILKRTLNIEDTPTPAPTSASSATTEPLTERGAQPAEPLSDIDWQAAQARTLSALEAQRSSELNLSVNAEPKVKDPLVLDLAGNGFSTRGLAQAVRFDLDADGHSEAVSLSNADDALLALDRNNNGRIDNGRELFGDQNGAAHGFAELAKYDDNADGQIDANDRVYSNLLLVQFDEQGRQRISGLAEQGIRSISLGFSASTQAINTYDRLAQLGEFTWQDGRRGQAADVLLATQG
ncbi:hypothetical protein [Atopomonas sediminilitoris]|uniref:hypothetical protein n=1 Tax=Atopomonas sediminilitoris TaxID=2919919 RepID=UPI001F4E4BFB|nr:hypothetical protein [Atopomonas sediminilitoris]MCJ8168884.1 hypothetical protein [Atopomonas sediminilitoris]